MTPDEIIDQYEPNQEYPSYYHKSDIEKMIEQYAKEFKEALVELVKLQKDYITFLADESNKYVHFAGIHGMKVPGAVFEKGQDFRNKIAQIEVLLTARTALDSLPGEGGDGWVSCDDRPLFEKNQNGNWVCTEDGDKEFIAAVPYHDKSDGKDKWWIRHCVIEDHVGMCVVCEDDNEPAGWEMSDVTHWRPLPAPPVQNENK